jgi:hypothetical protein
MLIEINAESNDWVNRQIEAAHAEYPPQPFASAERRRIKEWLGDCDDRDDRDADRLDHRPIPLPPPPPLTRRCDYEPGPPAVLKGIHFALYLGLCFMVGVAVVVAIAGLFS